MLLNFEKKKLYPTQKFSSALKNFITPLKKYKKKKINLFSKKKKFSFKFKRKFLTKKQLDLLKKKKFLDFIKRRTVFMRIWCKSLPYIKRDLLQGREKVWDKFFFFTNLNFFSLNKIRKQHYALLKICAKVIRRDVYFTKKYKKVLPSITRKKIHFCRIKVTESNIFVTLNNKRGQVLFCLAGGFFKAKRKRHVLSTTTTFKMGELLLKNIRRRKLKKIYLFLEAPSKNFLIKPILRLLRREKRIHYSFMLNLPSQAHNGCRFRRLRRK